MNNVHGDEKYFYDFFKNRNFESSRRFSGNQYSPETLGKFLEKLDNPQLEYKTIHIAGTTGKGSVATYLARSLQDFHTGLFVSPHLESIYERISVNGIDISNDEFADEWKVLCNFKEVNELSFFDALTAIAFDFFRKSRVDWAVFETGLGGRLDSTNVIEPEFSVITEIGLDHTNILGKTISEIAYEKGGIIKKKVPVYINVNNIEAENILNNICSELDAPLKKYPGEKNNDYQEENLNFVKWIYEDYFNKKFPVINKFIKGRLEKISEKPEVFFDSAHNIISIKKLIEWLKNQNDKHWNIYINTMKERDINAIIDLFIKELDTKITLYLLTLEDTQFYKPDDLTKNRNIKFIKPGELNTLFKNTPVSHLVTGSMRLYSVIKNLL